MDTTSFEEYQKQFSQWQKQFFDIWVEKLPGADNQLTLSEALEKTLSFQQTIVTTALKNQKVAIEAQEKLWENYFELLRNTPLMKP